MRAELLRQADRRIDPVAALPAAVDLHEEVLPAHPALHDCRLKDFRDGAAAALIEINLRTDAGEQAQGALQRSAVTFRKPRSPATAVKRYSESPTSIE